VALQDREGILDRQDRQEVLVSRDRLGSQVRRVRLETKGLLDLREHRDK